MQQVVTIKAIIGSTAIITMAIAGWQERGGDSDGGRMSKEQINGELLAGPNFSMGKLVRWEGLLSKQEQLEQLQEELRQQLGRQREQQGQQLRVTSELQLVFQRHSTQLFLKLVQLGHIRQICHIKPKGCIQFGIQLGSSR